MFEDFDGKNKNQDGRRFGASLALSGVVYLALGAGVVTASAVARQKIQEEELVQIELAPPPEPEAPAPEPPPPPPPKTAPPPSPRPKVERQALEAPEEIPDEKPPESDAPLADAPAAGTGQDGFTDGVAGGTGNAPAPPAPPPPPPPAQKPTGPIHMPENATPPVLMAGFQKAAYPEEARKAGIQGVVIVRFVIRADGSVTNVEVLRGPEVFHAAVIAAVSTWRYEPAKLPDGTPISIIKTIPLPFKLENM